MAAPNLSRMPSLWKVSRAALLSLVLLSQMVLHAPPVTGRTHPRAVAGAVRALRAAAETGRVGNVVGALAALPGGRAAREALRPVAPVAFPGLAGLPTALGAAIADLAGRVERAHVLVREAVSDRDRTLVAHVMGGLITHRLDPLGRDATRVADAAKRVDLGAMLAAAADLAAGVDRVIAAARAAGPLPAPGGAGCDIAEQPPLLCVSGAGNNVHLTDAWLVVDLGGADVYRNHAGVGACLGDVDDQEPDPCVGLSLDLAGADRYEPPGLLHACEIAGIGPEKGICSQGAGLLGLGMLVDAGGSDSYATVGLPKEGACVGQFSICAVIDAQGAARFGVGILADLGGDDSYSVTMPVPEPTGSDKPATVSGQGSATFGSALLWDRQGDDTYRMSGPATGYLDSSIPSWSTYSAQGVAFGGTGAVLDGGGADSFSVTAAPGPGAADRDQEHAWGEGGNVGKSNGNGGQGIGFGVGGLPAFGGVIEGAGDTEYVVDMSARFYAWSQGQAYGPEGYLFDDGGDDRYLMRAATASDFEVRCGECEEAALQVPGEPGSARAEGQGTFAAELKDRGGDDTYTTLAEVDLTALAEHAEGGPAAAVNGGGSVFAAGQAAGGDLEDREGDDRYVVRAVMRSHAEARSPEGPEATLSAHVGPAGPGALGQGAGGRLNDAGGADTYDLRTDLDASAIPEAPGSVSPTYSQVEGQGLFRPYFFDPAGPPGGLTDLDAGEPDSFHVGSSLLFDVCSGRHGDAPGWAAGVRRIYPTGESCSSGRPRAVVSSASHGGTDATLRITNATRVSGPDGSDAVGVSISLEDVKGAPIGGATVTLGSEVRYGEPYYGIGPFSRWSPFGFQRPLVTGSDGTATGLLSLPDCLAANGCDELRLVAHYDGRWGAHRPALGRAVLPPAA